MTSKSNKASGGAKNSVKSGDSEPGKKQKEIQVKVLEAKPKDVGKGEAHLDHALLDELGIKQGDFIFLHGKKTSVAIVQPGYYEDVGKNIIRIDGNIRRNIDVAVDEYVKVSKANVPPAEFISFTLLQQLRIKGGEEYLKQLLLGRCFSRNDVVEINIMGRRLELGIASYQPEGPGVYLTNDTTIKLGEEKIAITPGKEAEEVHVSALEAVEAQSGYQDGSAGR